MEKGLKKLRERYSDHIIEIIRLMIKFEEAERPSFVELAKLVLTSSDNSIDSPKNQPKGPKKEVIGNKQISSAFSSGTLNNKEEQNGQNT